MVAKILDGKSLSLQIEEELKRDFCQKYPPHLYVINTGISEASNIYVKNKVKACERVGIKCTIQEIPFEDDKDISSYTNDVLYYMQKANDDKGISGILVQLPVPFDKNIVFSAIKPSKDVDVFSPENMGLMLSGRPRFLPCTPQGIQLLLERNKIPILGKKITVINSSNIVGMPLFIILTQKGATVSICHEFTPFELLKDICLQSDIIIVGVGKPNFLTKDLVKKDAIIVDVGISRLENKVVGDISPEVWEVASLVTPVPGGVGPMTITALLQNVIKASRINY